MKRALLIFAKNAEAGKVKTRLAASVGDEVALAIYRELLLTTKAATKNLPIDKLLFYSSFIEDEDIWNNNEYFKLLQTGNDLGEKMKNAFQHAFDNQYEEILIIGTDCPGLTGDIIMNAFDQLHYNDVVIGPAKDGGYYLLGMKAFHPSLFEEIKWSTSSVLKDTISHCERLQLKRHLLLMLNDIDIAEDLEEFTL